MMVTVSGREIGVYQVEGKLYAARNRCPHQGGPVCTGGLFEKIDAEVLPDRSIREFIAEGGKHVLACPYHGWEYDLRDGRCLWNKNFHLQTYAVRADEAGNILLSV